VGNVACAAEECRGKQFKQGEIMSLIQETVRAVRFEMEVTIDAPPTRVFDAFVHNVSDWWGAPYQMNKDLKSLTIEPKVGGRMWEDWGNGAGTMWGMVSTYDPGKLLKIRGAFGWGNAMCLVSVKFEPAGKGTRVKLTQQGAGVYDDNVTEGFQVGWNDLLGTRLKAFVETGKKYGLGHEMPPGAMQM
jgi:uncharacterized protein YndB with AHSA1/START domain